MKFKWKPTKPTKNQIKPKRMVFSGQSEEVILKGTCLSLRETKVRTAHFGFSHPWVDKPNSCFKDMVLKTLLEIRCKPPQSREAALPPPSRWRRQTSLYTATARCEHHNQYMTQPIPYNQLVGHRSKSNLNQREPTRASSPPSNNRQGRGAPEREGQLPKN